MSEEVFLHGDKLFRRGLDGFWRSEEFIEVKKGRKRLKPIRGSKVQLIADSFLLDVKKASADDEKIKKRVQRLEEILPFEAEAIRRAVKNEGVLEIGVFHGGRKEKVKVQYQPNVAHEVEEKVNDAIKQILRGKEGRFISRKTDGGLRPKEAGTVRYVNEVLRDAYKKILKNRRAD